MNTEYANDTEYIDAIIKHAEYLLWREEIEMALKCLKLVPGYFRENPHPKLVDLHNRISKKITIPHDLLLDWREMPKSDYDAAAFLNLTARGQQLKKVVSKYNLLGITPHIIDLGPGDFCFAQGLIKESYRFTYEPLTLNLPSLYSIRKHLGEEVLVKKTPPGEKIFLALEIIEHLHHIEEIRTVYDRYENVKTIILSTPRGAFNGGSKDWESKECLPHLRTYTMMEFVQAANKLFPEIKDWNFVNDPVMVLFAEVV
jgi:hypothetical protein